MDNNIITITEHGQFELDIDINQLPNLNEEKEKKYLGIKRLYNNKLKANYYIGICWIGNTIVEVSPKEIEGKKIDFFKIFLQCVEKPKLQAKLKETYKIFNDQPIVKTGDDKSSVFVYIHFLYVLKNILQKGLKKDYIKKTENLTSKIKGKISIKNTIKNNFFKNIFHKTYCSYNEYSYNCLENRILKTAFLQCGKLIANTDKLLLKDILILYKTLKFSFEDIEPIENLTKKEFMEIKNSSFFTEYKDALDLAQMIFEKVGFSLMIKDEEKNIFPYYINMPEIFEKYVELKLIESNITYIDGNEEEIASWNMRPDFILLEKKAILDAKYKYFDSKTDLIAKLKEDFKQLALYKLDKTTRNCFEMDNFDDLKLILAYPYIQFNNKLKEEFEESDNFLEIKDASLYKSKNFSNFYILEIPTPFLENPKGTI